MCSSYFLAALVDLKGVAEFDWGTPALATLYGHLSACSQGVSLSLGGYHHVLRGISFIFLHYSIPVFII